MKHSPFCRHKFLFFFFFFFLLIGYRHFMRSSRRQRKSTHFCWYLKLHTKWIAINGRRVFIFFKKRELGIKIFRYNRHISDGAVGASCASWRHPSWAMPSCKTDDGGGSHAVASTKRLEASAVTAALGGDGARLQPTVASVSISWREAEPTDGQPCGVHRVRRERNPSGNYPIASC